jgi:pimeloyl-ACP methyl ester carboxylesterase
MLLTSGLVWADELPRRAQWEARFQFPESQTAGVIVRSLEAGSPLEQVGLQVGDHIVAVNGQPILRPEAWSDVTDALVAKQRYALTYKRGQQSEQVTVRFKAQPKEVYEGIDTIYDHITSDYGIRQRVIITKPKGVTGRQPAILLLQGLSCSSIEINADRLNAWTRLIRELVTRSNKVLLRVEKPGLGDSEGNCSETDFNTELNGYHTAAAYLKSLPYVDPKRIVVYGNSMGSALAPHFANRFGFAAVVSDGTYVKTWYEHMLEIERRILAFKGHSQSEITQKMNQVFIPLYHGMLIGRQSYQQVIDAYPAIAADNYHGPEHMYGRPMAFYQQLQQFDVAGAWAQLQVPARIRWGTHDWIMSEADNDLIIEILQTAGHQDHVLYKHPGLDHWQTIHESPQNSFDGKPGESDPAVSGVILDWLAAF